MTRSAIERRWWLLPVLCLSVFIVVVDNTIVNVALPSFARNLHSSNDGLQWIVDAYSLAFAGLLLAGGGIADRLGRKPVMLVGLVGFGLTSLWGAFASSTGELIAARGAMGVFAALIFPATLAILTGLFENPKERAAAIGIWSATSGLSVAVGPVLGGYLLEHYWAGSIFLVNVPIVAITAIASALWLPNSKSHTGFSFDWTGLLLSIVGLTTLVLTIIEGPTWGWTSTRTLSGFALSAAVLIAFTLVELRRSGPMLDVRIFRSMRFTGGATSISIAFFCLFGFIFVITEYFQFVRGYSTLSAGVHTLPFAIVAAITTPIGALVAVRIGPRPVVTAGLLSFAVGLVMASQYTATTSYWGPVVISMVFLSFGLSLVTAPATEAVMGSLRADQVGAGAAVNNTTRELGGTLGVAVLGSVFASAYAGKLTHLMEGSHLPATQLDEAKHSVAAAYGIASQAPANIAGDLVSSAQSAFLAGLHNSCLVGAGVAVFGAILAAALLGPKSAAPTSHDEVTESALEMA